MASQITIVIRVRDEESGRTIEFEGRSKSAKLDVKPGMGGSWTMTARGREAISRREEGEQGKRPVMEARAEGRSVEVLEGEGALRAMPEAACVS